MGKAKGATPEKPKKEKITIYDDIPLITDYLKLGDEKKFLEHYCGELKNMLTGLFPVNESGRLDTKFQGHGNTPTLFLTRADTKAYTLQRLVHPYVAAFLKEQNAMHLISTSAPSESLSYRFPNDKNGGYQGRAQKYFARRAAEEGWEIPLENAPSYALEFWKSRKRIREITETMASMKPDVLKALNMNPDATYYYKNQATFFIRKSQGGNQTLNTQMFVEIFGAETARFFAEEKPFSYFRVETEEERKNRIKIMKKREEERRLQKEAFLNPDDEADTEEWEMELPL